MWSRLNNDKNNKFQRLEENESRSPVEVAEHNTKCFRSDSLIGLVWRMGVLAVCASLIVVVVIMYVLQLSNIYSKQNKSVWSTSAHVNVHTYTRLARLKALAAPARIVSCYYNFPDDAVPDQLMPHDIHPYLCTHINIAFATIVNKEIKLDENQCKHLGDVVKLKQSNENLKVLLSVGGAGGDSGFPDMVVDHASRKTFIKSLKKILRDYALDGVDLDWEFPAMPSKEAGGRERQHFSQLLREIRMEYYREKRNYLLSLAMAAQETIVNVAYDVDQVNLYVDYVNIMTYDYHFYNKYTPFTGFNSPLYARSTEQMYLATLNINYTVHMLIDKGLDRNKMVVGIPTYGHTFRLVNENNPRVGSPASGYGSLGNFINYPDVCRLLTNCSDVKVKEDREAKVPYLYWRKDWVSYDSPESVMEKAKYIIDLSLRGAMIYSLNADDYSGVCSTGLSQARFPLSESVKNTLILNTSTIIIDVPNK